MGPLTSFVEDYARHAAGVLEVVRLKGLVVVNGREILVAGAPVPLSHGSKDVSFGGKSFSIDHKIGNAGEGWSIVVTIDKSYIESLVPAIIHMISVDWHIRASIKSMDIQLNPKQLF